MFVKIENLKQEGLESWSVYHADQVHWAIIHVKVKAQIPRGDIWFITEEQHNKVPDEPSDSSLKMIKIGIHEKSEYIVIVAVECQVFLLSDEGKTIERIN